MQPTEQFFSLHILSSKLVAEISIYMIDPIKLEGAIGKGRRGACVGSRFLIMPPLYLLYADSSCNLPHLLN